MAASHPPPPWRLRGEAVLVPARLRVAASGAAAGAASAGAPSPGPTPGSATALSPLRSPGGWSLGGVLLARYAAGSTLAYHELIAFSGLARAGGRIGFVVSHIAVDAPASVSGGREIWGLPKRLAEFSWTEHEITVAEGGRAVLRARITPGPVTVPVPLRAPFFGRRDGRLVHTVARGRMRAAPARVDLAAPAAGPLADLGLAGRRPGLAATGLELLVPPPRAIADPATGPG
jgi:hypothetical protein